MHNKSCGIYIIECLLNHKKYIGASIDIHARWYYHIERLRKNKHGNVFLQRSWNKYGEKNFIFYIFEKCEKEDLDNKEIEAIKSFTSNNCSFGYNLTGGGNKNKEISDETRRKIGVSKIGNKYWVGRKHSEESKIIIGLASKGRRGFWKGKKLSEETKRKLSESNKGKIPINKGIKMPEGSGIKQSLAMMGNRYWVGRKHSEETKQKLRGIKRSEETKQKLREAWARRKTKTKSSAVEQALIIN